MLTPLPEEPRTLGRADLRRESGFKGCEAAGDADHPFGPRKGGGPVCDPQRPGHQATEQMPAWPVGTGPATATWGSECFLPHCTGHTLRDLGGSPAVRERKTKVCPERQSGPQRVPGEAGHRKDALHRMPVEGAWGWPRGSGHWGQVGGCCSGLGCWKAPGNPTVTLPCLACHLGTLNLGGVGMPQASHPWWPQGVPQTPSSKDMSLQLLRAVSWCAPCHQLQVSPPSKPALTVPTSCH